MTDVPDPPTNAAQDVAVDAVVQAVRIRAAYRHARRMAVTPRGHALAHELYQRADRRLRHAMREADAAAVRVAVPARLADVSTTTVRRWLRDP